jgi:hypothetical protein
MRCWGALKVGQWRAVEVVNGMRPNSLSARKRGPGPKYVKNRGPPQIPRAESVAGFVGARDGAKGGPPSSFCGQWSVVDMRKWGDALRSR